MRVPAARRSCAALAIAGMVAIVATVAVLVIDKTRSSSEETEADQSVAIEQLAFGSKNVPAAGQRGFDERRLAVTGVVISKKREKGRGPVLVLRVSKDRVATVTLRKQALSTLHSIDTGETISVDCQTVRLIGGDNPSIDLNGCRFVQDARSG